jgi:hypothetical protein
VAEICFEGPVGINEADLLEAGPRDGHAHNILFVHELRGELDVDRLREAARWLGERHESLRTAFVRTAAGWRRLVHARSSFGLEVIDLSAAPDPEAEARATILARNRTAFDRAVPPLVRPMLVRLAEGRFWFVSHGDHVALDGAAFTTGLGELMAAYAQLCQGITPSLPPAPQPRDHVAATEAILGPLRAAPGPWCTPDPPDGFPLHPDPSRAGSDRLDPAGARSFVALGDADAVDAFARARGVSRTAPILAAMALGLLDLAARPDVAFTLIRSGRRDPAARGLVGCLAWGDSFAVRLDDDEPLGAVLARAEAFLRDGAPWRMLYIPMVEPASRRIVLNVNRYDTAFELPGLVAFPRADVAAEVVMWTSHDVLVQIFPLPGALQGVVRYRTSLFEPATIARFAATMSRALGALVADPTATVRSIG